MRDERPGHPEKPERVDVALLARGLAETPEVARALVMAGRVYLGEAKVLKPSELAKPGVLLSVRTAKPHPFVSRGGLKLSHALERFQISVDGKVCVDIGASTGGFTDVMLRGGAPKVYAVDVAYGQLDYSIRSNPRVVVMERTNARFLTPGQFDPRPEFGATDVSFISLKAVLPPVLALLDGADRRFVALVKPQFEAPPERVGARGVVRDIETHREVIESIVRFARTIGWAARDLAFSPVTGPEGNIEFLLDLVPQGFAHREVTRDDVARVTRESCDKFMKSV